MPLTSFVVTLTSFDKLFSREDTNEQQCMYVSSGAEKMAEMLQNNFFFNLQNSVDILHQQMMVHCSLLIPYMDIQ